MAAQTNLRVQLDAFNIKDPVASISVASAPIPEPAEVCQAAAAPPAVGFRPRLQLRWHTELLMGGSPCLSGLPRAAPLPARPNPAPLALPDQRVS